MDAPNIFIENRGKLLTLNMPKMTKGSQATDGSNLMLSEEDREKMISDYPCTEKYIKRFVGSEEFINNKIRYCLWLKGVAPNEYSHIPPIIERLETVRQARLKSPTKSVQRDADTPMLFTQIRQPDTNYLAIPEVSSEQRRYIPIGFLTPDYIASNKLYIVENADLYLFGVLISNIHMAWMRVTAGRLKSDYSYSPAVYNNFPWCIPTEEQKSKIMQTAQRILDVRAMFPDASLADLYKDVIMPPELQKAHQENDRAVMNAYGFTKGTPEYSSESACVAALMKLYQDKTAKS